MNSQRIGSRAVIEASSDLRYEFHGHPRYEPPEAYEHARDVFVERVADVPGVVSVYESGTGISVPGISDIDLIVVVEDDVADEGAVRDGIEGAKVDEYFFFHGPEVLTRSAFPEYYNVLPMPKDLYHHYGEALEYEKNRDEYNYLTYLVDSVNTTYPLEFLDFLFFPGVSLPHRELDIVANDLLDLLAPRRAAERLPVRVDGRFAVHRLNSLRNDMMLFTNASGRDAPPLDRFDRSITDLRSRWFDCDRGGRERLLLDRIQDAVSACFVFVDELAAHLDTVGVEVSDRGRAFRTPDVHPNEYRSRWNRETAERDTVAHYRFDRVKTCVLPQVCTVNERLRERDGTVHAPDEYVTALRRRDRTRERRDASMAAYKYHPLRARYMAVLRRLTRLKAKTLL